MKKRISMACIASILVPLATPHSEITTRRTFSIEEIFAEGGITGSEPTGISWSPDGKGFSFLMREQPQEPTQLWYVDAESGEKRLLASGSELENSVRRPASSQDEREKERIVRYGVASYRWSPDSKHLLFNAGGHLWLYSIRNHSSQPLTFGVLPVEDPQFAPDGKQVAYTRNHDIYTTSLLSHIARRVTRGGTSNLLNGEVDSLYAEQLDMRSGFCWSPAGAEIAFLQFDETQVPRYPITDWMPKHPRVDYEKYPKVGDPNPRVRLAVVDSHGGSSRFISIGQADTYIPRFGWVRDGILWAEVLDRKQENLDLYFIDSFSGKWRKMLSETAAGAWVIVTDGFAVLDSQDSFIWSSWRDGTTQLYRYTFDKQYPLRVEAKLKGELTKGDFEVLKLEGRDRAGIVYFSCNKDDPKQRHLYSVGIDGTGLHRISTEEGTHKVTFSPDAKRYLDVFSSVLVPPRLSVCQPDAKCRSIWQSRNLDDLALMAPTFLQFKGADGTTALQGELLLPHEPAGSSKIPLVVYIYGGPDKQVVTDAWMGTVGLFHQLLARRGIAVFMVDNRGTPGRDRKFQTAIRNKIGEVELADQMAALDRLFALYPQLDPTRIGIWGWSNGGSMVLYAMTHCTRFKTGVAIAPVTDWGNYASAYSERYFGLPKDTSAQYDYSILGAVNNLQGDILIVHGTSDDNVHLQNSIQLLEALIESGKQFRLMFYPNKTHGIAGPAHRSHLFHAIENQFQTLLLQPISSN